jgi:hypothetical protein
MNPLLSIVYVDYWATKLAANLAANAGILYDTCPLAPVVEANVIQQQR